MYTLRNLDFGITTQCNAGCSQCGRTNPATKKKWDWLKKEELSREDIEKIVPPEFFEKYPISKISVCGGYGDPLMHSDPVSVFDYFIEHAKFADIYIATNGAMKRNKEWWHELGKCLSKSKNKVEVTFGLDGVTDEMHAFHRTHTSLTAAIEHAEILQLYGVETCWQYIVFEHNEDYLEEAKEMAKKHNFSRFSEITATRVPVNGLNYPRNMDKMTNSRGAYYNNFTGNREYESIDCISERHREVHISASGMVNPCCFLDERYFVQRYQDDILIEQNIKRTEITASRTAEDIVTMYSEIDLDDFNGVKHGLEEVMRRQWWDDFLDKRDNFKINKCADICGKPCDKKLKEKYATQMKPIEKIPVMEIKK